VCETGVYKSAPLFGAGVTAAGTQPVAGFHSGRDTGRKTVPRRGINTIGWERILLAKSGGLGGKLVLFGCSLQELYLIKVVKLSYVILKRKEPARPSHSRTGIKHKQNSSNEHEEKYELEYRTSFPGNVSIKIDRGIFFLPFGKSKNP